MVKAHFDQFKTQMANKSPSFTLSCHCYRNNGIQMKKVHNKICNYVIACVLRLLSVHRADSILSTWQLWDDPDCSTCDCTCSWCIFLFLSCRVGICLRLVSPKVHSSALFFLDLNWIWQSCMCCHRFANKQVTPKWNLNLALSPELQICSDHLWMIPPRRPMNTSKFSRTKLITKPVPSFCK